MCTSTALGPIPCIHSPFDAPPESRLHERVVVDSVIRNHRRLGAVARIDGEEVRGSIGAGWRRGDDSGQLGADQPAGILLSDILLDTGPVRAQYRTPQNHESELRRAARR